MDFLFLIIGITIGIILMWLWTKYRTATQGGNLELKYKMLENSYSDSNKEKNRLYLDMQQIQLQNNNLNNELTVALTKLQHLQERLYDSSKQVIKFENELQSKQALILELNQQLATIGTKHEQLNGLHILQKQETEHWQNESKLLTQKLNQLAEAYSRLQTEHEYLTQKQLEQSQELKEMQERFSIQFENLANRIFEEKSAKFTDINKHNIDGILTPLKEKISDFERKITDSYNKESQERFSLAQRLKELTQLNYKLSEEANNLTNALKGQSKIQGNWGEMILERLLEFAGLSKDREYFIQQSFSTSQGKRLQPDVVVQYPGNRYIIVDSKVSLNAFERYRLAEHETDRNLAMQEHLKSIRRHITELSGKNYQELHKGESLGYVFMFVPIEPAYLLAIQHDSELWNFAYSLNIVLTSPTNLIGVLRMIADLWNIEHQNKNALEIASKSGELYDKFASFIDDLLEIGKRLQTAQMAHEEAMKKLQTGRGNLLKRAGELKMLGAKNKKNITLEFDD